MRLFEITGDPNANLEIIDKLTDVITRLRKQSLAERKLDADRSTQLNRAAKNNEQIDPPAPMPTAP